MEFGISALGRIGINTVNRVGGITVMLVRFVGSLKDIHRSLGLIIDQFYFLGVRSLMLILVTSVFVGAVAAWQSAYQFQFIGAPVGLLGHAVGKTVVIELAPVLTALVFTGRVGAGITAELGTMKVTEQIDALESMGISSIRYLVLPRVIACICMVPLLVVFSVFIAIVGAMIVAFLGVHISMETFLEGFKNSFQLSDFVAGQVKAVVFGLLIGIVGCYEGFRTKVGAEGVGLATTSSVVTSSVGVLVLDFVVAVMMFRL